MRRVTLIVSLSLIVAVALACVFLNNRRVKAVSVSIHVKDLPEHGLSLVAAGSPSFNQLSNAYAERHPETAPDDLEPFSVFIKNETGLSVIAYKIKWECLKADGTVVTKVASDATPYIFMYGREDARAAAIARAESVITPNTTWFVSLILPAEPLDNQGGDAARAPAVVESGQVESPQQATGVATLLKMSNAELAQYTDITVSIDGAFFDDGAFVGPDTTDYFAEIDSQMRARRDVLLTLKKRKDAGKPLEQIYDSLQQQAAATKTELGAKPNKDELYDYYKDIFVRDSIGNKNVFGADNAMKQVEEQIAEPWVQLRKK